MSWNRPLAPGLIAMVAAAWIVSTCDAAAARMVGDTSGSGIEGRVTLRPIRPVDRPGTPNSRAYRARITVLDTSGRAVAVVESDADGRFRVALPAGTYVLRPESAGRYPRAPEQTVVVPPNDTAHVAIVYDSGIR